MRGGPAKAGLLRSAIEGAADEPAPSAIQRCSNVAAECVREREGSRRSLRPRRVTPRARFRIDDLDRAGISVCQSTEGGHMTRIVSLLVSLLVGGTLQANARVLHVKPGQSIQAAVDAASSGDT